MKGLEIMTSERQAEANRLNATMSTGPRTPAGKAVVALKAVRHGLLSRESLVKGESEADLVDFGKRLRAQLAPVGELELLPADRIVSGSDDAFYVVADDEVFMERQDGRVLTSPLHGRCPCCVAQLLFMMSTEMGTTNG